ncbi:hypothetical protein DEU56DRAFT_742251 [Suillus clintonianus]|uniref:uncharacterized protein n=1 Tax=Suillus clintonianus TaxID=1904413 RepID=UPI001B87BAD8|nr:uncharacterized protein DEU56DRAFT_742251 [Suillus clintonianus]KAG2127709.1 hypothetical protein DEU56DRAFT_742251 [Suillus clintonianus]
MTRPNGTQDPLNANEEWAQSIIKDNPYFFRTRPPCRRTPRCALCLVLQIGCSDSRVPASIVTTSMPGTIFVHTNTVKHVSTIHRTPRAHYGHYPCSQLHIFDDNAHSVLAYVVKEVGVETLSLL